MSFNFDSECAIISSARVSTHRSDSNCSHYKKCQHQSKVALKSIDGIAIGFTGQEDLVDHIGIYSPKRILRQKYRPTGSEEYSRPD